ncbi:MAG: 4-(cytidine 5'-diphospho)-2-C-methyl-D-erythritol kinase, partial [Actinomycetota bacterium]
MSPREVTRRAHAKINVFLRVLGRRDDGFHEIETVVMPISLHDVVTVRDADGVVPTLDLIGDRAALAEMNEEQNLVLRAARALSSHLGVPPSVAITLDKRVPVAAGLGGGRADAAATLHALGELWQPAPTNDRLADVGLRLGSDVPAMLAGGPMLAS